MTITTLLSGLPSRTMDQATFDAAMANLMTNLPIWGAQVNTTEANMNAFAAGGAYAIPYTFDTTTTDSDPGTGKLRLDNATQNAATTIRLDLLGSNSVDFTSVLDTFDASTSTVKGTIRLVKMNDLTKWLMFSVTARATPTGYRNISVTCIGSSGASPFANGDGLVLFFQRNGDVGTQGPAGLNAAVVLLGSATVGSAVANIDFLSTFTSAYDRYVIDIEGLSLSAHDFVYLRLAKLGAADIGNVYANPAAEGTALSFTINGANIIPGMDNNATVTVEVRNANSATAYKGIGVRGEYSSASGTVGTFALLREGAYNGANAVTGFRLYTSGGANFTAGIVRVYGIKNT